MQQTGPRTVGEDRVLAGAQAKDLLQDLDGLAYRPGVGKRAEELAALVGGAAVVGDARPFMAGDEQVRVGLVVAEQDVVARLQRLDEVVFQDQRLGLRARDRDLQPRHLRHHLGDARAGQGLLEIRRDALLQVARLADIHDLAGRIQVPVHARQMRQVSQERFEIEVVGHSGNGFRPAGCPSPARRSAASGGGCVPPTRAGA